jgi:hypothetical protein
LGTELANDGGGGVYGLQTEIRTCRLLYFFNSSTCFLDQYKYTAVEFTKSIQGGKIPRERQENVQSS